MGKEVLDGRILRRLGPAEEILDVGCGDGRLVNFLAQATHQRVVGVDISDHGFAQAKWTAAGVHVPELVECVKGDAQQMADMQDGSFDAATLVYTLHHIDHPEAALREVHRVLKPRGRVLIGDLVIEAGGKAGGCYRFSAEGLSRMLEQAGFEHLEVEQVASDVVLVIGEKGEMSGAGGSGHVPHRG